MAIENRVRVVPRALTCLPTESSLERRDASPGSGGARPPPEAGRAYPPIEAIAEPIVISSGGRLPPT